MRKLIFFIAIMIVSVAANQIQITVTGIVEDSYGNGLPGVKVFEKGTANDTFTDTNGGYKITVQSESSVLVFSSIGFNSYEEIIGSRKKLDVSMIEIREEIVKEMEDGSAELSFDRAGSKAVKSHSQGMAPNVSYLYGPAKDDGYQQPYNTEEYSTIHENIFLAPDKNPLSTFSIDVDAASYSNLRRFINNGQNPPIDAVRIEEMVNYFDYEYEGPTDDHPFAIHTELGYAPWNTKHKLLKIGLQGEMIAKDDLPPSNLVFLLDVSGSMSDYNKLPLLKASFKMLVNELRAEDRVAIVVYAGAAGVVLPSTSGSKPNTIISALDKLQAGGSTAGGQGIELAYQIAQKNFIKGGNNRIILATDGDFNIGASSNSAMERLIDEKKELGVFLTVLGFGMGNYKDSKMEILADKGNGNYAYIDTMQEAEKVLKTEFGGTLFTIAKDVKIQVEFNPANVKAYRLIGYENRALKNEDFNNDKKDAGDLGSGHTVTALYEIIPPGVTDTQLLPVDELKYQSTNPNINKGISVELASIKLRYKKPDENRSQLLVTTVEVKANSWDLTSENFRWASSVAALGMILRESEFKGDATCTDVVSWAESAKGEDKHGYRQEFIKLAQTCSLIAKSE